MGQDLQLHNFDNGDCVGRTSLATTQSWVNKSTNEKMEKTEWHNIVFRNKAAEAVAKFAKKGSKLFVQGRLTYRSWEKEGQTHTSAEIMVNEFEFLTPKDGTVQNPAAQSPNPPAQGFQQSEEEHDDLPF